MASTVETSMSWHTLSDVIQRVRTRWRIRVALHGLTIVAGAAIVLLIGSAWLMNALHFGTGVIVALRVIVYAAVIALAIRYLVRPLRRTTTDAQVALYLEEHSAKLDAVVVSAVDATTHEVPAFVRSPYLVSRVVDAAVKKVRAMGSGAGIETRSITTSLATLAGMAAAVVLLMMFGPEFMRTGAHLLAAPTSSAHTKVFIGITPGDAKVARGGDQAIRAQLHGFSAGSAELVIQRGAGAWERIPMTALRDSGAFTIRLFDLRERTSYYVESEGIRSPTYHLDIVELPYVKNLALELRYPSYTGLPAKTIAKGGDIAVLRGTTVLVRASTTLPVTQAWIVVDGKPKIPMTRNADGTWSGAMTVTNNGFYKIELAAPNGDAIPGSLNYTIDMLEDAAPTITFLKPGRDVGVDSLAEVFSQVEATDDYGVAHLDLHYSVNGGAEQTVSLQDGAPRTDIVAGYTFFLKSLNLKPGDVISYYAQATDNDTPQGGQVTKTDIYFVTVKPHYKYEKGKKGQGQQGQQDQMNPGELVRKQRQIVAGTFKVDRDRARIAPQTLSENITTLSLSQNQLRNQVEQIGAKLMSRGLAAGDTMFQMILDEINGAATEMKSAENSLATQNIHPALGPEQRALQHLQRAESFNRTRQIQQAQGSQDQDQDQDEDMSKELANLFNLDTAQLGKQVEMQQRTPKKVDELAQKLKELADRLQREREMQEQAQKRAQQQGQPKPQSGDGGENQRQIAKDAEQFAKQLEQMAQQMGQQTGQGGQFSAENEKALRAAAQQLRSAAQDMRRAATGQEPDEADKAAEKLDAARQMVAQENPTGSSGQNSKNPSQQLLDRAHELMRMAQSLDDRLNQNQQGAQQASQGNQQGKQQQPGAGQKSPSQEQMGRGEGDQPSDKQQPGKGKGRSQPQSQQNDGQQSDQPNGQPSQSMMASAYGTDYSGAHGMNMQQLSREFREQRQSAEALRRDVQRQGGDTKALDQAISNMSTLESKAGEDKLAPQLQTAVVEGLKAWEFAFRRHLEGADVPRPVLGGNEDTPAEYKSLVDQYYQSLSKTR